MRTSKDEELLHGDLYLEIRSLKGLSRPAGKVTSVKGRRAEHCTRLAQVVAFCCLRKWQTENKKTECSRLVLIAFSLYLVQFIIGAHLNRTLTAFATRPVFRRGRLVATGESCSRQDVTLALP